jgi:hypothetical protein
MINTVAKFIKQVFIPKSEFIEDEIECAIDDEIVECKEMDTPSYTGVPAPAYLRNDEWFGEPVLTEKGMDVVQQEAQIKQQYEEQKQELVAAGVIIEDENIHQKMYEMATKNWNTVGEFLGGSENFQGGSENVHR